MSGIYLGDKPTKTTAVVNADEIPLLDSQDLSSGRKKVKKVTAANLKSSIGGVQSVVAGSGVSVDNTDPANPVVSASGGGDGPLVYAAVISQSGPQIPTVSSVLVNTANINPSFAYLGQGAFEVLYNQTINTPVLATMTYRQFGSAAFSCMPSTTKVSVQQRNNQFNAIDGFDAILKIEIYP